MPYSPLRKLSHYASKLYHAWATRVDAVQWSIGGAYHVYASLCKVDRRRSRHRITSNEVNKDAADRWSRALTFLRVSDEIKRRELHERRDKFSEYLQFYHHVLSHTRARARTRIHYFLLLYERKMFLSYLRNYSINAGMTNLSFISH